MSGYINRLRERLGHMKIVIPGVRGLLFDEEGRLLLQRRADFGNWGLPAGVVDVGDSAVEALKREVKEETGLTVLSAAPFGLYSEPRFSVTYPNGDEVQTFTIAFVVLQWTGELSDGDDEVLDVRFFPMNALPADLYPIHVETIEDYRASNGSFVVK
jgi:8-oxo-dGTP pyrophosphatase MutT (NUDIX family)